MDTFDTLARSANNEYWLNTQDMAFIKDINGIYRRASAPFAAAVGRTPEEVAGRSDAELFSDPELVRRYLADDARLLAGGKSLKNYVEPYGVKDGEPRYCLTSKHLLRDEEGKPIGVFGVSRDISPEYAAGKNYENELRDLFELPSDVYSALLLDVTLWRVVDARFREAESEVVSRYNTVDECFEGLAASVAEDEAVRSFFSGATREKLQSQYDSFKRSFSLEYLRRCSAGGERWARAEFHYLLDPVNGNLSLIIMLRDIDEARREYAKLRAAAQHDSMTGLLNHDATLRAIESHIAEDRGMNALFIVDLDNFKQVNDSFGHQYGDTVLRDVSSAIKSVFRSSDIVGRLGGDEFMALMKSVRSEEAVRAKADELSAALQFSALRGGMELELTASMGISLFIAGEQKFAALYNDADAALYEAKRGGKNRYTLHRAGEARKGRRREDAPEASFSSVQLHTLMEYMDGGVISAEVSGEDIHITYVSPSVYSTFGRSVEELGRCGERIMSLVLPEDLPGLRAALFKAAESSELLDHSYRVFCPGNQVKWRHIRAKRIPESGDGVHRLVAVITDITAMKQSDEYLRETGERYRTAVEQTNAMLWEVDIITRTLIHTGPMWKKYGYTTNIFPDVPESYLRLGMVHPDSLRDFRRMFADMYAGNDNESYFIHCYDEHGEDMWVKNRFRLLRDEDGMPYCALGITQAVPNINTEMRRFEQESHFADIVSSSLLGYAQVNLTQNRFEDALLSGHEDAGELAGMDYDYVISERLSYLINVEDVPLARELLSRERLLKGFRRGDSWQFLDFRRAGATGGSGWASLIIKLMRHPISGDVYCFGYIRENVAYRRWEKVLGLRDRLGAGAFLYSREDMELLARHIITSSEWSELISLTVVELSGLSRIRSEHGAAEAGEILYIFGRLCRIAISGSVVIGALDEDHVVILRGDVEDANHQRERVASSMALLKEQLKKACPKESVEIISGFAIERVGAASYDTLLKKALIACRSAAATLGSATAFYSDTGVDISDTDDAAELAVKYHALELRYQQLSDMLRVSENDELTGIPGKRAFYQRTRELLNSGTDTPLVIIRFDINRFKVYNDVWGTTAGDRLLKDIAGQLSTLGSRVLLTARLESDHFVLLAPDDEGYISVLEERLSKKLSEYSPEFRLSASVGVYRISDPAVEISLMCDRALLALKSVKSGFDTRLAYYDDELRNRLLEEQQLVGDMEKALADGEFLLWYQPQVNYEDGGYIGAEALVRWQHPSRGLLAPASFIPLFEQNGLITKLDKHVWELCCKQMRDWFDRYPELARLSIAVNVSRMDIYDPNLRSNLVELTEKYAIPASALRLEITESAYMENPRQLIDVVHELQSAGFTVEMDDFGCGYSSLNTLKDVSVDTLKLDMKFLSDCEDNARAGNVIGSVIRMAHWLKLPIIAEGVETKAQADYLKSLGCIYMQGYHFQRPMPANELEKLFLRGFSSMSDRYTGFDLKGAAAFWDPSAQTALLFNSFVGGAAIMEYRGGRLEVLRANDNYYSVLGTTREAHLPAQTNILDRFDEANRDLLVSRLESAVSDGEERSCEVHSLPGSGVTRHWTYARIRLLAKGADSSILYVAIEDITDRKRMEREQEAENERSRLLMQTTGTGFFDYDYAVDTLYYQVYIPGEGIIKRSVPNCGQPWFESPLLPKESAEILRSAIKRATRSHVDGEVEFRADLWGTGMQWCRMRYSSVEDPSGRVYKLVGQADNIQSEYDRRALSEAVKKRLNSSDLTYMYNDDFVNRIFGLFYGSSDVGGAIETTLALLGEYYDLSRVYVFEDIPDHTAMTGIFDWHADNAEPPEERFKYLPYDSLGGRAAYTSLFDVGGVFHCPSVDALPDDIRATLEPLKLRSILHCAIRDNGEFSGIVGFDHCRDDQLWTDEQVGTLIFVSRIIASFLLRLHQQDSAAFSADFRAALDDNSSFLYIVDPATFEVIYSNKAIREHGGRSCIGDICYREFIGASSPCEGCPVLRLHEPNARRTAEIVRADGMCVLSQVSPLRWNGRDMAMVSCIDITASKLAERELLAERRNTALILNSAHMSMWTYDPAAGEIIPFRTNEPYYRSGCPIKDGPRSLINSGVVMPESAEDYLALHRRVDKGELPASAVIGFDPKKAPTGRMRITYYPGEERPDSPPTAVALGEWLDEE